MLNRSTRGGTPYFLINGKKCYLGLPPIATYHSIRVHTRNHNCSMRTFLLFVCLLSTFSLSAQQPASEGSIKALKKVVLYGDNSEIVLNEGDSLRYNLSNDKVVIVSNGATIIKSLDYFDKLEKKGKIAFLQKAAKVELAEGDVQEPQTKMTVRDESAHKKLNILLGHVIVGDIALIVSIIRLLNNSN